MISYISVYKDDVQFFSLNEDRRGISNKRDLHNQFATMKLTFMFWWFGAELYLQMIVGVIEKA